MRELLGLPSSKGALIPIAVGQPMDARSWVLSDIEILLKPSFRATANCMALLTGICVCDVEMYTRQL